MCSAFNAASSFARSSPCSPSNVRPITQRREWQRAKSSNSDKSTVLGTAEHPARLRQHGANHNHIALRTQPVHDALNTTREIVIPTNRVLHYLLRTPHRSQPPTRGQGQRSI